MRRLKCEDRRLEAAQTAALQREIRKHARRVGGDAAAPIRSAEPIAEERCAGALALERYDRDAAGNGVVDLDREDLLACVGHRERDPFFGVAQRVGMWEASRHPADDLDVVGDGAERASITTWHRRSREQQASPFTLGSSGDHAEAGGAGHHALVGLPVRAGSSGVVSIIARTPVCTLKRIASSESAQVPDGHALIELRLPIIADVSTGSGSGDAPTMSIFPSMPRPPSTGFPRRRRGSGRGEHELRAAESLQLCARRRCALPVDVVGSAERARREAAAYRGRARPRRCESPSSPWH